MSGNRLWQFACAMQHDVSTEEEKTLLTSHINVPIDDKVYKTRKEAAFACMEKEVAKYAETNAPLSKDGVAVLVSNVSVAVDKLQFYLKRFFREENPVAVFPRYQLMVSLLAKFEDSLVKILLKRTIKREDQSELLALINRLRLSHTNLKITWDAIAASKHDDLRVWASNLASHLPAFLVTDCPDNDAEKRKLNEGERLQAGVIQDCYEQLYNLLALQLDEKKPKDKYPFYQFAKKLIEPMFDRLSKFILDEELTTFVEGLKEDMETFIPAGGVAVLPPSAAEIMNLKTMIKSNRPDHDSKIAEVTAQYEAQLAKLEAQIAELQGRLREVASLDSLKARLERTQRKVSSCEEEIEKLHRQNAETLRGLNHYRAHFETTQEKYEKQCHLLQMLETKCKALEVGADEPVGKRRRRPGSTSVASAPPEVAATAFAPVTQSELPPSPTALLPGESENPVDALLASLGAH